ncbi:A/G-specific adenine glycosylase [Pedobacter antarcticus]|uniref:A/G-specific adenine glycosylase n=1 Tax=Pedobacter antarcticus TaxID=34086 RepID=UPI001C570AD6|nr:A/G-specific adenine glycosylase [Pedobacter antarcticus]
MNFQIIITRWYQANHRILPWRASTDPYVIWLSEIILQQTRVEQGLPYFNRFLAAFPTVADFAAASETEILKLWQGLGYYSRGRNMLYTAREVMELHQGVFPVAYDALIKLKGIGAYTAAAISSFSSGESRAVLDGNVFRVLSRYFGIDIPINSTAGKSTFSTLSQSLIEGQDAALYNQAIMEFGALQCKPKSPNCAICPLQDGCAAYAGNLVNQLPVKLKTVKIKTRYLNYLFCLKDGQVLVNKRIKEDIWQHLYDFPHIETVQAAEPGDPEFSSLLQEMFGKDVVLRPLMEMKHLLTHQIIYVKFFALDNYITNFNMDAEVNWVSWQELDELPQPKILTKFIQSVNINS